MMGESMGDSERVAQLVEAQERFARELGDKIRDAIETLTRMRARITELAASIAQTRETAERHLAEAKRIEEEIADAAQGLQMLQREQTELRDTTAEIRQAMGWKDSSEETN